MIPPCISNWKEQQGLHHPARQAARRGRRGLQDVSPAPLLPASAHRCPGAHQRNFAKFSEALFVADRHAVRKCVNAHSCNRKLAQKREASKEEHLRVSLSGPEKSVVALSLQAFPASHPQPR